MAAVAATRSLPGIDQAQSASFDSIVPNNLPAVQTELRSYQLFRFPILSRVAVVQRNPDGLPSDAQQRVVARALVIDQHKDPALLAIAGDLPLTNTLGLFPGSSERSTTAINFLFFQPQEGLVDQYDLAQTFERRYLNHRDDALVGRTGAAIAQVEQGDLITHALPLVTIATVLFIALIVGLHFRSVGAPLVTLSAAAVAYLISVRVLPWVGQRAHLNVPREIEPLIIVLLLGVVTDYSIFFLSGMRGRIAAGVPRNLAARQTTAEFGPIILTAGLTVAAGTAALIVATLGFFRALGPGMALTVVIGLAVSITLVPALLSIFGKWLFWPRIPGVAQAAPTTDEAGLARTPRTHRLLRFATTKVVAAVIAVICLGGLVAGTFGLRHGRLGFTLISGLPRSAEANRAAAAAQQGFLPGILSPTVIVVERPGITGQTAPLARLEDELKHQPGVATVIGPADKVSKLVLGVTLSETGAAVRYVIILNQDPLGGPAIDDLKTIQARMGSMLQTSGIGLQGTAVGYAGDTALARDIVNETLHDLVRIALAALIIQVILLALFLRSLIAPLYLLAASLLAVTATLGLTVLVFQVVLRHGELTYFVPFAAAVLLVSFGSDYNIFAVGRIWDEARVRPLREAIVVAVPAASRAITIAGLALAGSFALLAIVPLSPFREFGFAMAVGVLLDSFVVRTLLVPALISLFGRLGRWPARTPDFTAPQVEPSSPRG